MNCPKRETCPLSSRNPEIKVIKYVNKFEEIKNYLFIY